MSDAVIELAREGKFPEEWEVELGITRRTFQRWTRRYPDFQWAWEMAWVHLRAYWDREVRESLMNPRVNTTALMKMLERRLPETWGPNAVSAWEQLGITDRDEPDPIEERVRRMSDEELEAELQKLMRQREIRAGS